MDMDLDTLSEKELLALRGRIEKALSGAAARRKAEARRAAQAAAEKHGFSLAELLDEKAGKSVNPPKFRNPADESQTWSGKGRQPGWIKAGLAAGKSLNDFLI